MKAWKMVACLVLLAVIICGCAVLGQGVEVSAKEPPTQNDEDATTETPQAPSAPPETGEDEGGSATVEKVYSEGLYFRSNGDGTCALAGLGSCTSSLVVIPPRSPAGDTVTEILANAFSNSVVGAIELPATVTSITAASFAGCPRLAQIRVASGSSSFLEWDGVLYSADGGTLIYCPAARNVSELTLHASLRRIAAGAFRDCTRLETIRYQGTAAKWHSVIVGGENDPLYAAALRFAQT